jgi:hypothetical protein
MKDAQRRRQNIIKVDMVAIQISLSDPKFGIVINHATNRWISR